MLLSALDDLSGLGNMPKVVDAILDLMPDSGVTVIDTDLRVVLMRFLKIDREFIRAARTSEGDQHVIRAIVGLAKGFGLQTIAEGVEDQETLDMLREFCVDHVQGFHVGRPAPLASPGAALLEIPAEDATP